MAGHHCSNSIIYSPVLLSFRFLLLKLNCFGCFTLVLVYLCLEANGNSIPNTFSWAYRWRTVYIQPLNETMLRLWISFSLARSLAKWKSNIHLERWTCQTQRNGETLRFATLWDGYHLICICQAQTLSSPSSSSFFGGGEALCVRACDLLSHALQAESYANAVRNNEPDLHGFYIFTSLLTTFEIKTQTKHSFMPSCENVNESRTKKAYYLARRVNVVSVG